MTEHFQAVRASNVLGTTRHGMLANHSNQTISQLACKRDAVPGHPLGLQCASVRRGEGTVTPMALQALPGAWLWAQPTWTFCALGFAEASGLGLPSNLFTGRWACVSRTHATHK